MAYTRKVLARTVRLDGRSTIARAVKTTVAKLKVELRPGRRLTHTEEDLIKDTALAIVASREARKQALLGRVSFLDASRAAGVARRMDRDLKQRIVRAPEPELSLHEIIGARHGTAQA